MVHLPDFLDFPKRIRRKRSLADRVRRDPPNERRKVQYISLSICISFFLFPPPRRGRVTRTHLYGPRGPVPSFTWQRAWSGSRLQPCQGEPPAVHKSSLLRRPAISLTHAHSLSLFRASFGSSSLLLRFFLFASSDSRFLSRYLSLSCCAHCWLWRSVGCSRCVRPVAWDTRDCTCVACSSQTEGARSKPPYDL